MRLKLAVALAVAAVALASSALFFYFRDNFATHYPVKVISSQVWRAGEIPWWNFYAGGGQPLAGNPNTLTFYPDNVFYLVLPPHVAFNLHFFLHLIAAWLAMAALCSTAGVPPADPAASSPPARAAGETPADQPARRRRYTAIWAASLYVLSGIAVSAMCFYNLITALALVPFALWAASRGRWLSLGLAFGLLALAGEPVTIIATALACAILWRGPLWRIPAAVAISLLIASPQLLAYSEIAREVERGAFRYSARTVLAASFDPRRLLELLVGPFWHPKDPHLFPTLLIGMIVLPAVWRRSRYTVVAAVMLFFALGKWNPLVAWLIEKIPALRLGRYPEKFALVLCVALIALVAEYFAVTRFRLLWTLATFVPLLAGATVLLPIDLFAPYNVAPQPTGRAFVRPAPGGQQPDRAEYRRRALRLEPIFGAVANVRYALDFSPDGMYSVRTRIAAEREMTTGNASYARIVIGLPRAFIVPRAIPARDPVPAIERPSFDPRRIAIAARDFVSPPGAQVTRVTEGPQTLEVDVATPAPALLFVNETYFRAWVARANGQELQTLPLDLDRLGVIVPAGTSHVTLTFGRRRTLVVAAWVLSSLAMALCLGVEVLDRRARQVERAADEERRAA